jgi:hypothetical protein
LALAIGDDHLDDLSASSDKIGQKPGLFVRHRPDVRFGRLDEMGDHRRVDRIGLGPFAERLGESAHLRQIDHDDRQARRRKARRNHRLTAAAIAYGASGASGAISRLRPSASRSTANVSPVGRTATSSRSFDTSMPTTMASILPRPRAIGLR